MKSPESAYMVKPELPLFAAHARSNDPETSKRAASSVVNLGRTRDAIRSILESYGPSTDDRIGVIYRGLSMMFGGDLPEVSTSGLRSRRSELVRLGLIEDSGQRAKTQSGRDSIIWRLK